MPFSSLIYPLKNMIFPGYNGLPEGNRENKHAFSQENGTMTQHVYGSGPCTTMLGFDTVEVCFSSLMNPLFWWKHREKTEKTWWILVSYDELWWWIMVNIHYDYDELWWIMVNYCIQLWFDTVWNSPAVQVCAGLTKAQDLIGCITIFPPHQPSKGPSLTGVSWANCFYGFWLEKCGLQQCNPGGGPGHDMSWSSLSIVRFQTFPNHSQICRLAHTL